MNHRERFMAALNYQPYDRLPVVHFGYWSELLQEWAAQGHISAAEAKSWTDGNETCRQIAAKLGFDMGFACGFGVNCGFLPGFERIVVAELPDGSSHVRNQEGVTELVIPGAGSIPAEIEHLLVDRASWEEHYKPRLQWSPERLGTDLAEAVRRENARTQMPLIMATGSALGWIRNWLGVVGMSYMQIDDPELLHEIITTVADLSYRCAEAVLEAGLRPDLIHYWEDICYNHGPLVTPDFFRTEVAPHYRRMMELQGRYGCTLGSIDCDGKVDELIPAWLDNGINVLFPIEIGTWEPDFALWRRQYGKELRGVGAMNKHVLSADRAAVDREVERLKPLVALGGFIPCPDHRLPPGTKWELVQYYTDRMRQSF